MGPKTTQKRTGVQGPPATLLKSTRQVSAGPRPAGLSGRPSTGLFPLLVMVGRAEKVAAAIPRHPPAVKRGRDGPFSKQMPFKDNRPFKIRIHHRDHPERNVPTKPAWMTPQPEFFPSGNVPWGTTEYFLAEESLVPQSGPNTFLALDSKEDQGKFRQHITARSSTKGRDARRAKGKDPANQGQPRAPGRVLLISKAKGLPKGTFSKKTATEFRHA